MVSKLPSISAGSRPRSSRSFAAAVSSSISPEGAFSSIQRRKRTIAAPSRAYASR
jgi:hypothetical protein